MEQLPVLKAKFKKRFDISKWQGETPLSSSISATESLWKIEETKMPTRFDGFYIARYEGLDADEKPGYGVMFLKDGKIYGGDNLSCFLGEFEDNGTVVVARVKVFLIASPSQSMTDVDDKPWDLPDIHGDVPEGVLPTNVVVEMFGQRHDTHQDMRVELQRIAVWG